jgi:hypothetical protein
MDFIQTEPVCCFKSIVVTDPFPLQVTRDNTWRMTKRSCVAVPLDLPLSVPVPGTDTRALAVSSEYFLVKFRVTVKLRYLQSVWKINLCPCRHGNFHILSLETPAGIRKWNEWILVHVFNSTPSHISSSDMCEPPFNSVNIFVKI